MVLLMTWREIFKDSLICFYLWVFPPPPPPPPGMSGSEVLSKVDKGYRMPRPTGGVSGCSEAFYEIVENCWKRSAEQRPTFAYLYSFFDDYFVNIEPNYQGPDD